MDPTYSPEAEAYREKVQAFLAEKLPSNWTGLGALEGDAIVEFVTEWRKTLYEANYLAPGWPAEYGGRGCNLVEWLIFEEEYYRAGAPLRGLLEPSAGGVAASIASLSSADKMIDELEVTFRC